MNREIKYQAYLHHEKQLVQVVELNFADKCIGYFDTEGMSDAEAFELIQLGLPNAECPFERCDLRQYTGLKDMNGVEIYEGDILLHMVQGKRKVYYPFDDFVAAYGLEDLTNGMKNTLDNSFLYEIIGNIYENPELVGESDGN